MWRYDANRSAASPQKLSAELHLQWVRQYPQRAMAWDDPLNHDRMPYDRVFEPVVMGKTMFIGFNDCDKVVALDTRTGREKWSFYTDGPVRLPPVAWEEKVYFASDDGFLYCVDASSGKQIWHFRGGPSDQKVLGNNRLISMWPARGGPVLKDGTIYFTASIWPFMGTFIYALDAETGEVVWKNDGTGAQYMLQPHEAPSFAGVAPQGALVVSGDKLLVPGGRSVPACFDRHSGNFLYYRLVEYPHTGGSFVCSVGDVFFNHDREQESTAGMYDLASGEALAREVGNYPVLSEKVYYLPRRRSIVAVDAEKLRENPRNTETSILWEIQADGSHDLIRAGNYLYAAGKTGITAIKLGWGGRGHVSWTQKIDGQVERLLAADGRLFAVTLDGRIMAFGAKETTPETILYRPDRRRLSTQAIRKASSILEQPAVKEGYAFLYGVSDADFLESLVRNSDLHVIAIDPDSAKVDRLRRRFDTAGLYGKRIAVHKGTPFTFQTPPYMASLTIIDELESAGYQCSEVFLERLFSSMRPYGGKLVLNMGGDEKKSFLNVAERADLHGLTVVSDGGFPVLSREGALAGSSDWTHQYGDIANTTKSDDHLVKLPLGILWFGGNSNLDVLPRHAHGPPEQVVGGRLFIEGVDCMNARDVYTGRVLWQAELDSQMISGMYYDHTYTEPGNNQDQRHIAGANARGTNFVAADDYVYVVQGKNCRLLDAATGDTVKTFSLPPKDDGEVPEWGYIGVYKDYLIAGSDFVTFSMFLPRDKMLEETLERLVDGDEIFFTDLDKTASSRLVVMNRHTGEILWQSDATHGFIHNAIAVGKDKIFCLDKIPPFIEGQLQRRGISPVDASSLRAFDIQTGTILWEKTETVFGSWLSYSKDLDILLQAKRPSEDMLVGERGKRMIAYRGEDGSVLWDRIDDYRTFPILHGEKIVTEGKTYDLLTGEALYRPSHLTGRLRGNPLWERGYGCNYPIASEHLVTFRAGAAGFYDLANDGGTGHFGGFKSGCTSNLIAADGVLNAPDYTRTCTCSYQNQTSLALVHMPDVEIWTYNTIESDGAPIERIGINFGAPGDRLADDGTLWLEYPRVGGPSPDIPVSITPEKPTWFRHHSSHIDGEGLKWVTASGVEELGSIALALAKDSNETRLYTVRLHFADPENTQRGNRVFDVTIQETRVLKDFDIVKEAGGPRRGIVREFQGIKVKNDLTVTLTKDDADGTHPPILCGIEVVRES
ncbi:MAG: PQQ-like beta-propeller repeat protein [Planctomycetota bacterium]|jgi:outer membrane protein assembly factor BamB